MRIGFDVSSLCITRSGVGTYVASLFDALQSTGQDTVLPLAHCGFRGMPLLSGPNRRLNKTLWMQLVLPFVLENLKADVCHFTNSVAPLWLPSPSVVTIHDMTLWMFPQFHYYRRLASMRPFIPLAARRASAIIAVSESTKRDIQRILRVPSDRIHVVHEAAAPYFRRVTDTAYLGRVRQQLQLPKRYALYVGNVEPRKNIERLVRAIARLEVKEREPISLVVVGSLAWGHGAALKAIEEEEIRGRVMFLGYVDAQMLAAVYSMAEVFVYPSLYEGFGLPVVEAMACGVPVITSPRGALREIAGDAAVYIDPLDISNMADSLHEVLTDYNLKEALRARGFQRSAEFSWQTAAAQTLALYQRAVSGNSNRNHEARLEATPSRTIIR